MKITDIRIVKVESQPFLKAYVTVTFDDELVVHNIRIVEIDGKFGEHAKIKQTFKLQKKIGSAKGTLSDAADQIMAQRAMVDRV